MSRERSYSIANQVIQPYILVEQDILRVEKYKSKRDIQNCTDYWGIKLIRHIVELCERFIEHRLQAITRLQGSL